MRAIRLASVKGGGRQEPFRSIRDSVGKLVKRETLTALFVNQGDYRRNEMCGLLDERSNLFIREHFRGRKIAVWGECLDCKSQAGKTLFRDALRRVWAGAEAIGCRAFFVRARTKGLGPFTYASAWSVRLQIRCAFSSSSRIFENLSTPPNRSVLCGSWWPGVTILNSSHVSIARRLVEM
jgi:hypothetical protein